MKSFLFSFALLFWSLNSYGAFHSAKEGYFVFDPSKASMRDIGENSKFTIDHISSDGYEVYGPAGTGSTLQKLKLKVINALTVSKQVNDYPSFTQMEKNLRAINAAFPKHSKLFSIGKTVKNKDLWFIKLSKNAGKNYILPRVKLISSMHGDEITGRELLFSLIKDLLNAYGKDPETTALIDNSEIYIMPSMNPDGSEAQTRANGNDADLNRDFPDFNSGTVEASDGRQPETKAMMAFQEKTDFALSANFHGGAEVVNYMWDSMEQLHPFDHLLYEISLDYASRVPYLYNSTKFPHGITNGYAWYVVRGGMQDWSYFWHGDTQFTIELSQTKWPKYSDIPQLYADNKSALLGFLKRVHQGAGFYFSRGGISGQVEILSYSGRTKNSLGSFMFHNSSFYKILEPGRYSFRVFPSVGQPEEFDMNVEKNKIYLNGNYYSISFPRSL